MSKRFKAEIEFKKNTKEEEFNRKLLHNIKVAERKQKEKKGYGKRLIWKRNCKRCITQR